MCVEYILWPFHPKVCVWKAGPEPSFQELFNSLFVGTTPNILCLFNCKSCFNRKCMVYKSCFNKDKRQHVRSHGIPSHFLQDNWTEDVCGAVFQICIGLCSEACFQWNDWQCQITTWWHWLPAQIHIRQRLSWNGERNSERNPLPKVVWHWAHWS